MWAKIAYLRRDAISVAYFHYLVKKVNETGIVIDKLKGEKPKTVRTHENIRTVAESMRININSPQFSTIEHFGDVIETNFA